MRALCVLLCMLTAIGAAEQARSPGVSPRWAAYHNTTTTSSSSIPTTSEPTTTSLLSSTWTIILPPDLTKTTTTTTTTTTSTTSTTTSSTATTFTTSSTDLPFVNTTSSQCIAGSVATYIDNVYPTSYVTVDTTTTFTITVADGNSLAGIYEPTVVYETPLAACSSTVLPIYPVTSASGANGGQAPGFLPIPSPITVTYGDGSQTSILILTPDLPTISSHKMLYTSTVVVTKKTSVPELYRPTDVVPSYKPFSSAKQPQGANDKPTAPSPTPFHGAGNDPGNNIDAGSGPDAGDGSGLPREAPFLFAPTNVVVDGVPVIVQPTVVVIGGSSVVIATAPPSQSQTVVVGSQTFTVFSSQIVGPHTTLTLDAAPSTITQAASTVTKNGVVVAVGPTLAVISGTTYRLGPNISPITITVDSQTITLNSNGVVFPSDTVVPPMTLVIPQPQPDKPIYKLVVVDGVTMSIDASEAIIHGTTYRIGIGASSSTTVVDGHTITLCDVGVVIESQTVTPTSIRPDETAIPSSGQRTTLELAQATDHPESHSRNSATNKTRTGGVLALALLLTFYALYV